MSAPLAPTVHWNGTSKQSLMDGYIHAIEALRKAQNALSSAAPNPRDYYVQGDGAANQAAKEHAKRYRDIAAIIRELEQIAEAVFDQGRTP
jgi:hypothetical protein